MRRSSVGKRKAAQEVPCGQGSQHHGKDKEVNQQTGHYLRAEQDSGQIKQPEHGIKQFQLEHAGTEAVGEIPEGKIPAADMVYNGIILHNILFGSVGAAVRE